MIPSDVPPRVTWLQRFARPVTHPFQRVHARQKLLPALCVDSRVKWNLSVDDVLVKTRNRENAAQRLGRPIGPEELPTRLHSLEAVKIWHIRRVILDSSSFEEAASRLGITKKTLWELRRKHRLTEQPSHR
jgi:hypothetical protein